MHINELQLEKWVRCEPRGKVWGIWNWDTDECVRVCVYVYVCALMIDAVPCDAMHWWLWLFERIRRYFVFEWAQAVNIIWTIPIHNDIVGFDFSARVQTCLFACLLIFALISLFAICFCLLAVSIYNRTPTKN